MTLDRLTILTGHSRHGAAKFLHEHLLVLLDEGAVETAKTPQAYAEKGVGDEKRCHAECGHRKSVLEPT